VGGGGSKKKQEGKSKGTYGRGSFRAGEAGRKKKRGKKESAGRKKRDENELGEGKKDRQERTNLALLEGPPTGVKRKKMEPVGEEEHGDRHEKRTKGGRRLPQKPIGAIYEKNTGGKRGVWGEKGLWEKKIPPGLRPKKK